MTVLISPILGIFSYVYLKTSNDLKRLDGMAKSPVFTHLRATIEGLATIRASAAESSSLEEFDKHQDQHSSACYMYISSLAAFVFYIQISASVFIGLVTFSLLLFQESLGFTEAEGGLSLSQTIVLATLIQWSIYNFAELVNQLISVERVLEYENLPREIQPKEPRTVPHGWPNRGEIVFENVGLRYFGGGPLILKQINLVIKPKEKIGIVGRTGAGKSSLISALFRLCEVEGVIRIDQEDTKYMDLNSFRSAISIIPQDPVLFSGTLRFNLDPFEEYTDDDLYRVIEDVELRDPLNIFDKLENRVSEKGSNYSLGQKQLICLARAILKNSRIVVLDEATTNLDSGTEALIQKIISKKFVDSTVLTVAHRLNTVIDSDKILVMDAGTVAEFDHPYLLLQNPEGMFYKMVEQIDRSTSLHLRTIAADNFLRNRIVQVN